MGVRDLIAFSFLLLLCFPKSGYIGSVSLLSFVRVQVCGGGVVLILAGFIFCRYGAVIRMKTSGPSWTFDQTRVTQLSWKPRSRLYSCPVVKIFSCIVFLMKWSGFIMAVFLFAWWSYVFCSLHKILSAGLSYTGDSCQIGSAIIWSSLWVFSFLLLINHAADMGEILKFAGVG